MDHSGQGPGDIGINDALLKRIKKKVNAAAIHAATLQTITKEV